MVKAKILFAFAMMAFAQWTLDDYVDYSTTYEESIWGGPLTTPAYNYPSYDYYEETGYYGDDDSWLGYGSDPLLEGENYGHEHLRTPASTDVEPPPPFSEWAGIFGQDPNEYGSAVTPSGSEESEDGSRGPASADGSEKDASIAKLKNPGQECLDRGYPPESCCETCVENLISAWVREECTNMEQCAQQQDGDLVDGTGEGSL